VKKELTSGTDVIYLYDGWQVIEEREWDENGEPGGGDDAWEACRQYIYGGTYIDEPLIFDKDTDSDGDCTDDPGTGSSRYFYCQQANFNVVALTDDTGAMVEKIKYDPYGEATVSVQSGQSASGNPYLFQGRRSDSDSDLYYFRNRDYHPVLGRFMQRDPAGYADGMNLYQFIEGQSVYSNDPYGLGAKLQAIVEKVGLMGLEAQYINLPGCRGKAIRAALARIAGTANVMIFEGFLKVLGKATWKIAKKAPGVGQYLTATEMGYELAEAWAGHDYEKGEFVAAAVSLTLGVIFEHYDASPAQEYAKKQLEKAYSKAYEKVKARYLKFETYSTSFYWRSCTTKVSASWDPTTNGFVRIDIERRCTADECGEDNPPMARGRGAVYEYHLDITTRASVAGKLLEAPKFTVFFQTCCCK